MELFLRLAGVIFFMSVFSSLSSLPLAVSLAGGLLFLLGAIMIETTKRIETTKTTETIKTTDMQTIKRRKDDDI